MTRTKTIPNCGDGDSHDNLAVEQGMKSDTMSDTTDKAHLRTVAIHTQGCKLNQADSEALVQSFAKAGYRVVDRTSGADVVVVNTCTVTAAADAKARQALRAASRSGGDAVVVATGCYAQRAAGDLARMEEVSLVVGNTRKEDLVSEVSLALAARDAEQSSPLGVASYTAGGLHDITALRPARGRNRSMVKIQEGCNQVCAYCIVPKVRGRERSIPVAAVVERVKRAVNRGCREVVLTGTQLGSYGFDLEGATLLALIQSVLAETDVARLRVSSLQPQEIVRELLDLWTNPRLMPHFHIPLQNGNDRILRLMRRRYDTDRFAQAVDLVRRQVPDAGITSDLIVGFPGEGEAEFHVSRDFVRQQGFSDMHIFPYSSRPGTSAAYLKDQVPAPLKKARAGEMAQVAREGFREFRLRQLGDTRPVLWESARGPEADRVWTGLTDNYLRVITQDQRDLGNQVMPVKLQELDGLQVTCSVQ